MFRIFKTAKNGDYVKQNDLVKRSALADTMDKIANADDPVQLFYNGSLTPIMVSEIQSNGTYVGLYFPIIHTVFLLGL